MREADSNRINEETLRALYITQNMRLLDVASKLGLTKRQVERRLSKYGIKKDRAAIRANAKATNLEKYGTEHSISSPIVKAKVRATMIDRYGVENPGQSAKIREKMKKTSLDKYGVENPALNEEIKKKTRATLIAKYGVDNPYQIKSVRKKAESTNLKKYGTKHAINSPVVAKKTAEIQKANKARISKKRVETNLSRYGVEYSFQSELVKSKIKDTMIERYGVSHPSRSPEISKRQSSSRKDTMIQRYGRPSNVQSHILHIDEWLDRDLFFDVAKKSSTRHLAEYFGVTPSSALVRLHQHDLSDQIDWLYKQTSSYEHEVRLLLDSLGINYSKNDRSKIGRKEIDIYIDSLKLGIEFNGDYWHQSSVDRLGKPPLSKTYHHDKSKIAQEAGINIYHIFEYEWLDNKEVLINQLKNLLRVPKRRIYARNTTVREISANTKRDFLTANHRQGNDRSSINLGLFYDDELVAVMTFKKPYQNKTADIELSRFCSLANVNVIGGASKLFKYFTNNYQFTKIVSYQDIARTSGHLYSNLGFTLSHISPPNYVWVNPADHSFLSRYQTQMKNEIPTMIDRGYVQIFDCGNKVWVYGN